MESKHHLQRSICELLYSDMKVLLGVWHNYTNLSTQAEISATITQTIEIYLTMK